MKNVFIPILFIVSITVQAQHAGSLPKAENTCGHSEHALHYYNWQEVEHSFAQRMHIPLSKCRPFFSYAFSQAYLSMNEYRAGVKAGAISQYNATAYWLNKLAGCEDLYKNKYLPQLATAKGINSPMASCNNLDFGSGTLSNWTGQWNNQGTAGNINNNGVIQGYGNITVNGMNTGGTNSMNYVHEICTAGQDPNVPISRVPPGHTYSLRLGNDSAFRRNIASPTNPTFLPFHHQVIANTFLVTPANKTITYWYAVALTQSSSAPHPQNMQPYFKIRMYDSAGAEIMCVHYDVDATSAATIGGFHTKLDASGTNQFLYKDWSPVFIPLINYMGQTVTITFETSDCAGGGHFGYAYLAVDCTPFAEINISTDPCKAIKTLTAPPGLSTYAWVGTGPIIGPANTQSITVNTAGTYTVTMTTLGNSGNTCTFSLDTTVTAPPPLLVASFTTDSVCQGSGPTHFTDHSILYGDSIVAWNWNFGDGTNATTTNPSHLYTSSGNFQAIYTISVSNGCTYKDTVNVIVYPQPIASFYTVPTCLGSATEFHNTSTGTGTYSWTFGNANAVSASQNPQYTYPVADTYTVGLTLVSPNACVSSYTSTTTILPIPQLTLVSPAPLCAETPVPLLNYSLSPNDTNATYTWINTNVLIGLPASGTGLPPLFTTAQNTSSTNIVGIVSVTPSLNGCTGPPAYDTIRLKPTPHISHPDIDFCATAASGNIVFTAVPAVPNNNISWTNTTPGSGIGLPAVTGLGNIPSFTGTNSSVTLQTAVVSLQAVLNGCTGPASLFSIGINPKPTANFIASVACSGAPIQFADTSVIGTGSIVNWAWDFNNDGIYNEDSVKHPVYTLAPAGNHPVGLLVSSNKGCTNDTSIIVCVNPNPVVSFSADSAGCTIFNTEFTGTASVAAPQYIQSWLWDFGNGQTSVNGSGFTSNVVFPPVSAQFIDTSHTQIQSYTVSVKVVSNIGCTTILTKNNFVHVYPQPKAAFTWGAADADVLDPTLYFYSQAIGASGPHAYNWNFGDVFNPTGNSSVLANPWHTYSDQQPYTYTVMQVVENNYGCIDSVVQDVLIHPAFTFYIPNAFTPNHDGKNDGFKGTGIGIDNSSYNLWIFDRWGNQVFHSNDLEETWNGRMEGTLVQEDTYVWKAGFRDVLGHNHQYKGIVTVVR